MAGAERRQIRFPTNHQPPTTSHQPPATSHQFKPPTTSHQPPATSHQPRSDLIAVPALGFAVRVRSSLVVPASDRPPHPSVIASHEVRFEILAARFPRVHHGALPVLCRADVRDVIDVLERAVRLLHHALISVTLRAAPPSVSV